MQAERDLAEIARLLGHPGERFTARARAASSWRWVAISPSSRAPFLGWVACQTKCTSRAGV